jgi:hypothetical protein
MLEDRGTNCVVDFHVRANADFSATATLSAWAALGLPRPAMTPRVS